MAEEVLYAVADGVATVTLNRPGKLNASTPAMFAALRERLNEAEADPAVRCIVITGAGRGFCAGADMGVLQGMRHAPGEAPAIPAEPRRFLYVAQMRTPLIAAINGAAAGVGFVLALYCDLRFVAEGAKLTTAFAKRGLIAEHGTAWLLPRLVGPMNAADLLLTGRTIDATEAERLGLARRLPAEDFLAAVQAQARAIAEGVSPRSTGVIKRQMRKAAAQTLAEAVDLANAELAACRTTEDFREGVAHFLEKRAPRFTGR